MSTRTGRVGTEYVHPELAELGQERRSALVARYSFAVARLALGWTFLWAFLDKTFGWGYATPSARAWINGGSPTTGFLKGVKGPFDGFFNAMAGDAWADWLFMAGLLGIGVALMAGVFMRIAAGAAAVLLVLMWMASLPLDTNPFMDDHLVYAIVIIGLAAFGAGDTLGLGRIWSSLGFVQRYPVLR